MNGQLDHVLLSSETCQWWISIYCPKVCAIIYLIKYTVNAYLEKVMTEKCELCGMITETLMDYDHYINYNYDYIVQFLLHYMYKSQKEIRSEGGGIKSFIIFLTLNIQYLLPTPSSCLTFTPLLSSPSPSLPLIEGYSQHLHVLCLLN